MPKCAICKEKFTYRNNSFEKTCANKECMSEFALKFLAKKREADAKKIRTDWNKQKRELKNNLKTLGEYEAEARRSFQKWIRKRDEFQPCISCDKTTAKQWDGGHYLKAELFSGYIFNEDNCHKQCSQCNDYFSGNELEYRDRLVHRIGVERLAELENNKNKNRMYKFSKLELVEIKNKYDKRYKEMK